MSLDFADWIREYLGVKEEVPQIVSTIRVTFNRPLTYAEREYFYRCARGVPDIKKYWFTDQGRKLYLDSMWDSRDAAQAVIDFVEVEYLNVYPKAVWTVFPEVKV